MSSDEDKTQQYSPPQLQGMAATSPMNPNIPLADRTTARTPMANIALDQTIDAPHAAQPTPQPTDRMERLHNALILHDQFVVRGKLGQGGMGEVWLAHDQSLDREVAIKVLAGDLAGDHMLKARFIREARAQAKLTHPHIVPIYFIGEQAGMLFFVMERVLGRSLAHDIEHKQSLDWTIALALMIKLAQALKHAQTRGIIHRDIKPGNILIDEEGQPKLADFGLAKPIDDSGEQDLTAQNAFIGTPWYMPPEQSRSEQVDHRADMYALGATFYHLVTLKPPFEGNSGIAVMLKHASEPLTDPRTHNPNLPARFSELLMRLMAKAPEARFNTYDELIHALEHAKPKTSRPAGLTARALAAGIDLVLAAVLAKLVSAIAPPMPGIEGFCVIAYFISTLVLHRITPGMWLLQLQLKDANHETPTRPKALLRLLAQAWSIPVIIVLGLIFTALGSTQQAPQGTLPLVTIAYIVSVTTLLILQLLSFASCAFHPKKRALYDLLTKTYVVYRD